MNKEPRKKQDPPVKEDKEKDIEEQEYTDEGIDFDEDPAVPPEIREEKGIGSGPEDNPRPL